MPQILDLILFLLLSTIPAAGGYFLDYCLGHPMSDEPKTKEIFSRYSIWLAKRRIGPGKLMELREAFSAMLNSGDPEVRRDGHDQLKKTIMLEGKKGFNWEKAVGMCPYCTNFWLALGFSVICFLFVPLSFFPPFCYFVTIPILSHTYLRNL